VLVRTAVAGDIPTLVGLVRRYWAFEGIPNFDALRIELLLKRLVAERALGELWLAQAPGGGVCGYLALVHVMSLEHGGLMGEIDELFVAPEARRSGAATALIEAAQHALRARGGVRLQLQLATGNAAARGFYERRGFRSRAGFELLDKPL